MQEMRWNYYMRNLEKHVFLAQKEKELFETEAEIKDVQKNSKLNEDFAKTEKKLATIRAQVTSTSKELLGLLMNPANLILNCGAL